MQYLPCLIAFILSLFLYCVLTASSSYFPHRLLSFALADMFRDTLQLLQVSLGSFIQKQASCFCGEQQKMRISSPSVTPNPLLFVLNLLRDSLRCRKIVARKSLSPPSLLYSTRPRVAETVACTSAR